MRKDFGCEKNSKKLCVILWMIKFMIFKRKLTKTPLISFNQRDHQTNDFINKKIVKTVKKVVNLTELK